MEKQVDQCDTTKEVDQCDTTKESDYYDTPCTHTFLLDKGVKPNPDYAKYKIKTDSGHELVYHRDHIDRQANQEVEKLSALRRQNDQLLEQLGIPTRQAAEVEMRAHLDRLHEYNEVKDAGQAMIGRLAVLRETTTRALYPQFGLDYTD